MTLLKMIIPAVCAILLVPAPSAAQWTNMPRICFDNYVAPVPVKANGETVLAYELHVTNFYSRDIRLRDLTIVDYDRPEYPLCRLDGKMLRKCIMDPLAADRRATTSEIGALQRHVLVLMLTIGKDVPIPSHLSHRLRFSPRSRTAAESIIEVPYDDVVVSTDTPLEIASPVDEGPWWTINVASARVDGHRQGVAYYKGELHLPQRYAVDFVKLGPEGRAAANDGKENKDWFCYGEAVYAVADATVIVVRDSTIENVPFGPRLSSAGNCVWLDLGNGRYAFYGHLQPNSLRVARGDHIRKGQVLGLIGNSGNSDLPHLHFSIHGAPVAMLSESIPFVIQELELVGARRGLGMTDPWTPNPLSPPVRYQNQWFQNDCVYVFPSGGNSPSPYERASQEAIPTADARSCLQSRIRFDSSSLEAIVLRPEDILADVDAFWRKDDAYKLMMKWHEFSGVPLPLDRWKTRLKGYAAYASDRRKEARPLAIARKVMEEHGTFLEKALPHICSFLPENGITLDTTVYFTTILEPYAFQIYSDIVIDPNHFHWLGSSARILNSVVHEVFHIGFGGNQMFRAEHDLENQELNSQLTSFQNEGLATYVAYKALPTFPASGEKDYAMLEDPSKVQQLREELNRLFARAESMSPERLRKETWNLGVQRRAYYVVGAHMARTIDDKLGPETLVDTILRGPRFFVGTYNSVAEAGMHMYEFYPPETPSVYERLRLAAVGHDYAAYGKLLAEIEEAPDVRGDSHAETLIKTGRVLLHYQRVDLAIDLLGFCVDRFPDSAAAHHFLGEACLKNGDQTRALKSFRRALELEPGFLYSIKALRNLERTGEGSG